jgi:hypothetical protein
MPRDGAIIFADLIGKLDVLYVHCPKCSRAGRYGVQHLVEARGRNARLIDWLGLAEGAVVRAIKGVAENQKSESASSNSGDRWNVLVPPNSLTKSRATSGSIKYHRITVPLAPRRN